MSEQVITDEDAQQTDIRGFLRKMKRGEPLNTEATTLLLNRIFNILESLAGEGCMVDKPLDNEGLGWRIIIDGSHSDLEPMGRVPMPFELMSVDNAWHVWLKDAEVVLNNFHATKAESLTLDDSESYSTATFGVGANVFLYVYSVAESDGTKHSASAYFWDVATSVPTGALASIQLAQVRNANLATQYQRGNQILYSFVDSEIIRHDADNAVMHVRTGSPSHEIMPVNEHLGFVLRSGGVIRYYKATDLLEVAFEKAQDLIREEPDPEVPESEWIIGDETREEWEERMKAAIRQCLTSDGWPYQPKFNLAHVPAEERECEYFGGYGNPTPCWRGIKPEQLRENHLPPRDDLTEALRLLALIRAKLDSIDIDPDDDGPLKSNLVKLREKIAEVEVAANDLHGHMGDLMLAEQAVSGMIDTALDLATANQEHYAEIQDRQAAIDADVTDLEGVLQ